MRSHPFVGSLFVLVGLAFLVLGAFAPTGKLQSAPMFSEVILPFILWQFAAWALLLGVFFLRPRRKLRPRIGVRPTR